MKDLVFLVGCQRSGTTWLQKVLGGHPQIGTAQESHVFDQFIGPAMRFWDQVVSIDAGRGGVGLPAYLTRGEFDALGREMVERVLAHADEYHARPVFLEKTPDHVSYVDIIHRLFPAARVVMVVRRPEDVVESLLAAGRDWGRNWAPRSVLRAAWRWRRAVREGMEQLASVPAEQQLLVRYEDMREDPVAQTCRVLEFIGVDADQELVVRLCDEPSELNKYGHFARQSGNRVQEPEAFRRARKGSLNPLQNLLVRLVSRGHARQFGY
jgi:hypothetical protein